MSLYLNMNQNIEEQAERELRARVHGAVLPRPEGRRTARDNYTQADIAGLARAFTGWRLNGTEFLADGVTPNPDYGKITFTPSRFDMRGQDVPRPHGPGRTGVDEHDDQPGSMNWGPRGGQPARSTSCSRTRNHAQFLIRKLWARVHRQPDPAGHARQRSVAAYRANGYKLKPLIRGILMHPLIFESIDEPNLIKPPIVYMVGVLRQLGAPLQAAPSCRAR